MAGLRDYNLSVPAPAKMHIPNSLLFLLPLPLVAATLFLLLRSGLAWRLAVDEPNHRSLHTGKVPRIGGLVIVLALLAVWTVAMAPPQGLLPAVAVLAVVSYADDHWGMPVVLRFAAHTLVAAAYAGLVANPGWTGLLMTTLALAWLTNLYNFMDGANGLAGGMAVFGFGVYGLAALPGNESLAFISFGVAAAAAGFLLFNFHPARVFMGDVGSIPLGFLAGAIGLAGWTQALWPAWFPLLVFAPFVVDASVTLVRRGLRGERVWQAHREHYYQRLVRMGWSHRRLALHEYALMAALGASALALQTTPDVVQWAGLAAWLGVLCALMWVIDRRWRNHTNGGRP